MKKLWEKDPSNWDKYINQVLSSYRVTPNLATAETPFFLVYGRDTNLPLHQLLEPMQCFLGDPDSGMLNLEAHRLTLHRKHCMKNTSGLHRRPWTDNCLPSKYVTGYILRTNNQASGISNGDLDTGLSKLSMTEIFCTLKTRLQEKYALAM